ncbi:E3 ubiquitin-protein ligase Arkadia-like [Iris pallida]|uniref:RING-type E3 ubiquitin transferase n=1 Tax=Iris pallida TaxID=29817 RepID=A0AAX6IK39_IRIPA|nr:E3 ubiquitin-protein ligase Arkadia-like [Iris pallida]KAJ6853636.1 E3 ubiquitin-protein ligase Arkadia-like [Iris pallida]
MGDWNCQMIDRKSEHSYSSQHRDYHNPSASLANYPHYVYHQLGVIQFYHQPCYNLSAAAALYCHNAASHNVYISAPSSIGLSTNEQSEVTDSHRVAYKRKHSEVAAGDYHLPADPGSSSANSRQLQHEESNENGFNVMTLNTFTSAESLENVKVQTEGAQHGSERSSEFLYNNYSGQAFQPSSFGSVEQHENYSHGGGCYNWNHTNPASCVNGRYLESGAADIMNAHMQEYKEAWTYGNPAFVFPFSNQNQHQPSMQTMQVLSSQNVQALAPYYWFPVSNLQSNNVHPSDENLASGSQIMQVPLVAPPYWLPVSNVQTINAHPSPEDVDPASRFPSVQVHSNQNIQILTPHQLPVSDLQTSNAHPSDSANRSPRPSQLIAEEVYWSHQPEEAEEYEDAEESDYESDSDLHGDMRLDIEDMSYEQLLALEESMGDVNTGISEDSILKNLKTSVCAPLALTLSPLSSGSLLNERCTVCLVEYEEEERIGTLDCGHSYHADCIKEWLLIKNQCPICRTRAVASGGED